MGSIPWPFSIQLELTRPWWLAAVKEIEEARASDPNRKSPASSPALAPAQAPATEPADARGLDRKGTDLAAALEVATAAVPPFYVPRIVLLSDGNATAGDAIKT